MIVETIEKSLPEVPNAANLLSEFVELMRKCWNDPNERPTMDSIYHRYLFVASIHVGANAATDLMNYGTIIPPVLLGSETYMVQLAFGM